MSTKIAIKASAPLFVGDNKMPLAELLPLETKPLADAVAMFEGRYKARPRAIMSPADLDTVGVLVKDGRVIRDSIEAAREEMKRPFLDGGRLVDTHYGALKTQIERMARDLQLIADEHAREVAERQRAVAAATAARLREEEEAQRTIAEAAAEAGKTDFAEVMESSADIAAFEARGQERIATAAPAELVRSTTESGVLTSAKAPWTFEIEDLASVDLNVLRPYLSPDAIEKAIRAAIRAGIKPGRDGKQPVAGVRMFQEIKAVIR